MTVRIAGSTLVECLDCGKRFRYGSPPAVCGDSFETPRSCGLSGFREVPEVETCLECGVSPREVNGFCGRCYVERKL